MSRADIEASIKRAVEIEQRLRADVKTLVEFLKNVPDSDQAEENHFGITATRKQIDSVHRLYIKPKDGLTGDERRIAMMQALDSCITAEGLWNVDILRRWLPGLEKVQPGLLEFLIEVWPQPSGRPAKNAPSFTVKGPSGTMRGKYDVLSEVISQAGWEEIGADKLAQLNSKRAERLRPKPRR